MVRTLIGRTNCMVVVTIFRENGSSVLAVQNDLLPSDAFDYAAQALGYFRFAIQEMDCQRIEIDVRRTSGSTIELIEITRD